MNRAADRARPTEAWRWVVRDVDAAVLEVVRDAARHDHEGTARRVEPCAVDEEGHRALDDEEDVVLGVRVRAGPLRVRLEPPLRD